METWHGAIVDSGGFVVFRFSVTANNQTQAETKARAIHSAWASVYGTGFFWDLENKGVTE